MKKRSLSFCLLVVTGLAVLVSSCAQFPGAYSDVSFRCDPQSKIVIESGGPANLEIVRFATEELQRYFSQMLGQKTTHPQEIQRMWPDGTYRIRLARLGSTGASARLKPGPLPNPLVDEFEIDVSSNSITLTATNAASLLYAVYELLQEQGCHWLFPGTAGEIVPAKPALAFSAGSRRTRADLSMRGLFPVENLQRYSVADVRQTLDWMAKNRMNYFVPIINYGWQRLNKAVIEESRKRGIRLVGYLWSFELFLPLEMGVGHPEYFALIDGERRVEYNVKRCASSALAIRIYVENARKWLRAHPELEELIVKPNDGYHWCQCEGCRRLKPKDQWAAFFTPLWQKAAGDNPRLRLHNFIYVHRYDLPNNIKPYVDNRLDHIFDVHQRNKWFSLRDPGAPIGGHREAEVDERARTMALNSYLTDRLRAWRSAVQGRVWIYENLMLHATCSIPVPNLDLLAADLRAAREENIQGYLFEAYLHGWNSFAADLWSLARLCWSTNLEAMNLEEDYYRYLLGEQGRQLLRFFRDFRASHLTSIGRCGLYWMHCRPEAAVQYIESLRFIDAQRLSPVGHHWHAQQLKVAEVMQTILRQGSGRGGSALLVSDRTSDTLEICRKALETGRAMDGVVLAYSQLQSLFMRKFQGDALNFRPLLPATFDPEVRALFAHQKLWDTLAEWDSAGRFPRNLDDPDRWLREILERAIDDGRVHF